MAKPGRNDRCPCGSGKKYKACCLTKDDAVEHVSTITHIDGASATSFDGWC
jgi:SEC-C motif